MPPTFPSIPEAFFTSVMAAAALGIVQLTVTTYPFLVATLPPLLQAVLPKTVVVWADCGLDTLASTWDFDPRTHDLPNKCALSALLGYWAVSALVSLLDVLPGLSSAFKVQGSKSFFTFREWCEAVAVSMFNLGIVSWVITIPMFWVYRYAPGREANPQHEHLPWRWQRELPNLVVIALIIDLWFYWTHRALHHPALYGPIHKMHHRFKAPTAVACMYAHPIEFAIGNHMGVILGIVVTHCHPYTAFGWIAFALMSTAAAHSGYRVMGATAHDQHHEFFNYNFGVGITDSLFGTEFNGRPSRKPSDKGKKME